MLDRLTGMQVFQRVAATGSLSGAARVLRMSQTMATKHVAALEARLGAKLFYRTTRRLTLTEAGRTYLEACERILADVAVADEAVSAAQTVVSGTLRLNVPVSFGILEIAPVLPEFAARYPGLTVDLGLNDRQVDLVEEGWDLAIRIGTMKDSTLQARRLASCRMLVCAAPSYLEARGTPRAVAELKAHDCLGYTLSRIVGAETWAFGKDGKVKVAVSGSLRASNGDALVAAAVGGQGIIYQPTFLVAPAIRPGRLQALQLDKDTIEMSGIYAVFPSGRAPPAKVRAMIDFLLARFAPVPPWDRDLQV
ncbi:MAG: LysR family transcriptional regulator [Hyphomicrobiales bacterium]|nr:MAG: LysR family transcriptional regulator [Hyphomicrobiales bacterium]